LTILLDTQIWLWLISSPGQFGSKTCALLQDPSNTLLLSAASSWEIAIKYALGKLDLPEPPGIFVPSRMARDGIASLPIEHAHALYLCRLPPHHRDPFDRLLLSQASVENIPLLTADRALEAYGVPLLSARA
jgi:PIN domain nuclease of toxin-antitoxin system